MSALSASWENTLLREEELPMLNKVYLYLYLTSSVTLDIPRNTNNTNQLSLSRNYLTGNAFRLDL
mgnify:CR=1 FL=1